jgi:hypothetical protein
MQTPRVVVLKRSAAVALHIAAFLAGWYSGVVLARRPARHAAPPAKLIQPVRRMAYMAYNARSTFLTQFVTLELEDFSKHGD